MTGRVQTLRSNIAGNRPTGRVPGELYVNWPDLQLGVINSANAAQDLIAVRFFSATSNYNKGDYVVQGGSLYSAKAAVPAGAFNASQWAVTGGAVTVSDTAPNLPSNGQLWYDSVGGQLYVYYTDANSSQWVVAVNNPISSLVSIGDTPPNNPAVGQFWFDSVGQQLYVWYNDGNSSQWVPSTNQMGGGYVPLSGGTMTGTLVAPNISAPQAMGDNRIINGDMRIDQRNNGASGVAIQAYMVDRWNNTTSQAGVIVWGQNLNAGAPYATFPYYLGGQAQAIYTAAATDYFSFTQAIEADMISDFAWGTVNAQPVTLSFMALATKAGTYSGSIRNYAGTRAYPFTFTLGGSIWTGITIKIPGDTAGTWVLSGNGGGAIVSFDLGSGANFRGAAGTWGSGNFIGATGAANIVTTLNAQFFVTGVKLEIGSVATPFNRQSLAKSMADCQRYYQVVGGNQGADVLLQGYANAGNSIGYSIGLACSMRVAGTATLVGSNWTVTNASPSAYGLYSSKNTVGFSVNASATGYVQYYNSAAGNYIALNAEL